MATFKPNQLCRIVERPYVNEVWIGKEVRFVRYGWDGGVSFYAVTPDCTIEYLGRTYAVTAEMLAPLTDPDPKADEFIAKLKKLGPLPVKEIA